MVQPDVVLEVFPRADSFLRLFKETSLSTAGTARFGNLSQLEKPSAFNMKLHKR